MKATKPNPRHLLLIAFKAAELEILLKELGTMPSYSNPNPDNLLDTPWSPTTLANLAHDLASVTSLIDNEIQQEEWGITDEMVDEVCEFLG